MVPYTLPPREYRSMKEWKPIPGFTGYEASSDGEVRSHVGRSPRILKQSQGHASGYLQVCIRSDAGRFSPQRVHRLIALTFLGPCREGNMVCHNNGNCKDNCISNLRYGDAKSNSRDMYKHGTVLQGEKHPGHVLSVEQVLEAKKFLASGMAQAEVARQTGIHWFNIRDIANGRNWGWLS